MILPTADCEQPTSRARFGDTRSKSSAITDLPSINSLDQQPSITAKRDYMQCEFYLGKSKQKSNPTTNLFHSSILKFQIADCINIVWEYKRFENRSQKTAMASCEEHEMPHFTFIWTLENVTERTYLGLTSPSFVPDTIDKAEWCLVLWEREGKLLCRPCKDPDDRGFERIEIQYETAVIKANGSVLNEKRQKKCFESELVYNVRGSSDDGENVLLEQKDKSNLKGILTIRCRMWKPGNVSCNSGFCFAHTRLRQERRYFTWIIPEFSSLTVGQMRSFHLQITPRGDLLPVLDLYLQYDDGEEKVCIEKTKKFPYELFCKVSIVDVAGNVACSKSISDDAALIKISKLMSNKTLYLPNDVLYLRCECHIDFGVVSNRIENYEQFSMPTSSHVIGTKAMNDDMTEKSSCCPCCCPLKKIVKKYYENGELTDVNLRAGNESFPAHKIILSAKSQVFEEMFTKDKSKKGRKVIELTDFDPDILRRLLLYMYSENVEDLTPEAAVKLYKVAIKYELQDLREKCSKFLESNLCIANIFTLLALAEKQEDNNLKRATRMFIFEHDNEIFDSDDWENFKKKNPILAMDVMQYVYCMRRDACDVLSMIFQQLAK
ncbi:Speckle-type POZ protein B [Araneus ventricosus]|uniref:Speckle-type POZ protein B n=1 Tax=Araneus ventricosus TaxID=182803 RepID=A0A4Y2DM72_ARAVE|nr:Speckle-type POZ protein B [Araneus ventricosus]